MHVIWKTAILAAALGGLSMTGAGAALADTGQAEIAPLSVVAPMPADWPFDDLDDLDDVIRAPIQGHIVAFDDDWDDWGDDDWGDD